MKDFRKLMVWEKAHQLTLDVYKTSENFPDEEKYGLTSQLRRACTSIATNIAEGCGRGSDLDFARMLQIAMGSACEVEYLLLLSVDIKLLNKNDYIRISNQTIEVKKMLTMLIKKLKADR